MILAISSSQAYAGGYGNTESGVFINNESDIIGNESDIFAGATSLNTIYFAKYDPDSYRKDKSKGYDKYRDFGGSKSANGVYDPFEKVNRKIYRFNEVFDIYIARPIAKGYGKAVPKSARRGIRNFLRNLNSPIVLLNSILQGNVKNSFNTTTRFAINSTVGILGIFDVAARYNIANHKEDFGQTLAVYGVSSGPYLMIPFLGPSTLRDITGRAGDTIVNPFGVNALEVGGKRELVADEASIAISAVSAIDTRESLIELIDDVRETSFDPYATFRSAYMQNRRYKIKQR